MLVNIVISHPSHLTVEVDKSKFDEKPTAETRDHFKSLGWSMVGHQDWSVTRYLFFVPTWQVLQEREKEVKVALNRYEHELGEVQDQRRSARNATPQVPGPVHIDVPIPY